MATKPEATNDDFGLYQKYNCPIREKDGNLTVIPSAERDMAHEEWDLVYGMPPLSYEVYALLDGNRHGCYEIGPFKFNHEPFYIGQGKIRKRHKDSKGKGRQQDKFTLKVERINDIIRIGGHYAVKHQIINTFYTQEKAKLVERKLIRLIGQRYLTNHLFTHILQPLMEADYQFNEAETLLM